MSDIIQTIEQDAVVAWDDFLKGITWISDEAKAVAAFAVKVDPGIQQQLQALLTAGEAAAGILASAATGGMSNIVAAAASDAETLVANFFQGAMGGSSATKSVSAATVNVLTQATTALQAAIPVAVAKVLATLKGAAGITPASVTNIPPNPTPAT